MDIVMLHRKGVSQRQIARKLGISRNTVKKYVENPEFPESRWRRKKRKSLLDPYRDNIKTWLEEDMDYTAVWIYERLRTMGFDGSYEIVKRRVGEIKSERQKIAYMRFETESGHISRRVSSSRSILRSNLLQRTDAKASVFACGYAATRWSAKGFAENEKKNDAIQKMYYQTLRSLRALRAV